MSQNQDRKEDLRPIETNAKRPGPARATSLESFLAEKDGPGSKNNSAPSGQKAAVSLDGLSKSGANDDGEQKVQSPLSSSESTSPEGDAGENAPLPHEYMDPESVSASTAYTGCDEEPKDSGSSGSGGGGNLTNVSASSLPENSPSPKDTDSEKEPEEADRPMTLMEHLNELRRCLARACIAVFVCFIGCWAVVDPIFNALVDPLLTALPAGSHAMYTTLPEGFFTRMFIAFVAGFFVASPVIFYQIWSFIAPGLYEEEKRYIIPIALLSAVFFIGGGLFCFFIVFPYVFTFFISFATESIVAMPKVSDYLDFVLKLLIAFGLIFEMPLFTFFLARLGIVTAQAMRRIRRYAILAIFIVAAILTPPDVVSQLLMAGPMLILYELSILIAALFGKKKRGRKKTEDEAKAKEQA